jgi:hypothetical protein
MLKGTKVMLGNRSQASAYRGWADWETTLRASDFFFNLKWLYAYIYFMKIQ